HRSGHGTGLVERERGGGIGGIARVGHDGSLRSGVWLGVRLAVLGFGLRCGAADAGLCRGYARPRDCRTLLRAADGAGVRAGRTVAALPLVTPAPKYPWCVDFEGPAES